MLRRKNASLQLFVEFTLYTEIVPPETVECLALEGARSGSRVLVFVVVRAYRQGRYAEYAEEIERWYVPVYEKWLHS